MRDICWRGSFFVVILGLLQAAAPGQQQKMAELGDFALGSGQVIRDCHIGYRTVGTLSADKSNAILMPTWAGGSSLFGVVDAPA